MEEEINPIQEIDMKMYYSKTFLWMFMGLVATAITAFTMYSTNSLESVVNSGIFIISIILELILVLVFNFTLVKMPVGVAKTTFFIYAVVNGLNLSVIFYVYELQSIVVVFAIAAFAFLICAYMGAKTDADFSRFSTWFFIFAIVGILVSLLNLFVLRSGIIDLVIDLVMLILFLGATAYDMNISNKMLNANIIDKEKIHVYTAMQIYLDFINIFLRMLSIFGKKKD